MTETYKIKLDGKWSLVNFYELPRSYAQIYALHYALNSGVEIRDEERLDYIFKSYPWRGGYSAVNFYNGLYAQIPRRLRPTVKSIRFASPGYIELALLADIAKNIGTIVTSFSISAYGLHKLYQTIYKGLKDRELLRIKEKRAHIKLAQDELNFIDKASNKLATALNFKNLEALNGLTKSPLITLKILMSYYRRTEKLAKYVTNGKADFSNEPTDSVPTENKKVKRVRKKKSRLHNG